MKAEIAQYFAFSTGTILFVLSVRKMVIDRKNLLSYLIPLFISIIILAYGIYRII